MQGISSLGPLNSVALDGSNSKNDCSGKFIGIDTRSGVPNMVIVYARTPINNFLGTHLVY